MHAHVHVHVHVHVYVHVHDRNLTKLSTRKISAFCSYGKGVSEYVHFSFTRVLQPRPPALADCSWLPDPPPLQSEPAEFRGCPLASLYQPVCGLLCL